MAEVKPIAATQAQLLQYIDAEHQVKRGKAVAQIARELGVDLADKTKGWKFDGVRFVSSETAPAPEPEDEQAR